MINGMLVLPIAFTLLTLGPSLISAPEVSLYTLIETVLGPIWVWLGGYEAPPVSAIFGGTLLIIALGIHRYVYLLLTLIFIMLHTINSVIALREDAKQRDPGNFELLKTKEVVEDV